ncbi:hypothetical protein [Geodermatophilus sp. SYSU D01119]
MHVLTFRTHPDEGYPGALRMVPVVDGVPLTELVTAFEVERRFDDPAGGYDGVTATGSAVEDHARDLVSRSWTRRPRRVQVLGCDCGISACWPLEARVVLGDRTVTWDRFRQPHRPRRDYSALGPFVFDAAAYRAAVAALVHPGGPGGR